MNPFDATGPCGPDGTASGVTPGSPPSSSSAIDSMVNGSAAACASNASAMRSSAVAIRVRSCERNPSYALTSAFPCRLMRRSVSPTSRCRSARHGTRRTSPLGCRCTITETLVSGVRRRARPLILELGLDRVEKWFRSRGSDHSPSSWAPVDCSLTSWFGSGCVPPPAAPAGGHLHHVPLQFGGHLEHAGARHRLQVLAQLREVSGITLPRQARRPLAGDAL